MNIGELYSMNCRNLGSKPALVYNERTISHEELEKRTNQFAQFLLSIGYQKGDRIAILSKNHIELPVIMLGAAKAGVIFTPINYRMTASEITSLLQHFKPRALFFSEEYVETVRSCKNHIAVEKYVNIDRLDSNEDNLSLDGVIRSQSVEHPQIQIDSQDTYFITYTSGTTGKPKGGIVTHESRCMQVLVYSIEFGIKSTDIQLVVGPIYHAVPHILLLTQLVLGGTLVIMKEFEAIQVLENISNYKVTNLFMVPTMCNFILELEDSVKQPYDMGSVKTLISSGSALPTSTKERIIAFFNQVHLFDLYGASEIGGCAVLRPEDQLKTTRSIGKPVMFNDVKIFDSNGDELPAGEVGEIYIKNPYHFKGYLDNPVETEKAFKNGYITVGDLGRKDENGFIYLAGRKKDMVISGGVNIYPDEIEDVLYKHPDVLDVAVIGIPDKIWGESLKAFIVRRNNQSTEQELIDFCKQNLASYKKPKSIEFVNELPRNAAGKILKKDLRAPYWAQPSNI